MGHSEGGVGAVTYHGIVPHCHLASHQSAGGQLSSSDITTALGFTPAALDSPSFTGTPTAPTASFGTNTTQLATTAFVQAAGQVGIRAIATKVSAYTLTSTDYTILGDATSAAFILSLPASPAIGQMYHLKKIDASANSITISGNGKNIDGASSIVLAAQWQSWSLHFDGTAWYAL